MMVLMTRGALVSHAARGLRLARALGRKYPNSTSALWTAARVREILAERMARRGHLLRAAVLFKASAAAYRQRTALCDGTDADDSRAFADAADRSAEQLLTTWSRLFAWAPTAQLSAPLKWSHWSASAAATANRDAAVPGASLPPTLSWRTCLMRLGQRSA